MKYIINSKGRHTEYIPISASHSLPSSYFNSYFIHELIDFIYSKMKKSEEKGALLKTFEDMLYKTQNIADITERENMDKERY
jgi:hypothetical protein